MKKLLLVLAIVLITSIVNAASLVWDASTGNVNGYVVYYTLTENVDDPQEAWNSKKIEQGVMVENIRATLNLNAGSEYFFYVTAYNDAGQSGKSNTVTYVVPKYIPPEDSVLEQTIVIPGVVTIKVLVTNE